MFTIILRTLLSTQPTKTSFRFYQVKTNVNHVVSEKKDKSPKHMLSHMLITPIQNQQRSTNTNKTMTDDAANIFTSVRIHTHYR